MTPYEVTSSSTTTPTLRVLLKVNNNKKKKNHKNHRTNPSKTAAGGNDGEAVAVADDDDDDDNKNGHGQQQVPSFPPILVNYDDNQTTVVVSCSCVGEQQQQQQKNNNNNNNNNNKYTIDGVFYHDKNDIIQDDAATTTTTPTTTTTTTTSLCRDISKQLIEGYNTSLITYGAAKTGKTDTLFGNKNNNNCSSSSSSNNSGDNRDVTTATTTTTNNNNNNKNHTREDYDGGGLLSPLISSIFDELEQKQVEHKDNKEEVTIRCSVTEIIACCSSNDSNNNSNSRVRDLLYESNSNNIQCVRNWNQRGGYSYYTLTGCTKVSCISADEVVAIVQKGQAKRSTLRTSTLLIQLYIEQKQTIRENSNNDNQTAMLCSQLQIYDLLSSSCTSSTKSTKDDNDEDVLSFSQSLKLVHEQMKKQLLLQDHQVRLKISDDLPIVTKLVASTLLGYQNSYVTILLLLVASSYDNNNSDSDDNNYNTNSTNAATTFFHNTMEFGQDCWSILQQQPIQNVFHTKRILIKPGHGDDSEQESKIHHRKDNEQTRPLHEMDGPLQCDISILQEQNKLLQEQQRTLQREMQQMKHQRELEQQQKDQLQYQLRISQFREQEAIVYMRQLRRFYYRLLKQISLDGNNIGSNGGSSKVAISGAPDLQNLIDIDYRMMESGLLEKDEVQGADIDIKRTQPSTAAMEYSKNAVTKIISEEEQHHQQQHQQQQHQQQQQHAGTNGSSVPNDDSTSFVVPLNTVVPAPQSIITKEENGNVIEARQKLYQTPAGKYVMMRENVLEQQLFQLSQQVEQLKHQLNEERTNIKLLRAAAASPNGVLIDDQMRIAQQFRFLKDQINKKDNDLKAMIYKMNELHMISKSIQMDKDNCEQHMKYIEGKLLMELQNQIRNITSEKNIMEQQLTSEIVLLKKKIDDISRPIWNLPPPLTSGGDSSSNNHTSAPLLPPLSCRLIVPFNTAKAFPNEDDGGEQHQSVGDTDDEWISDYDFGYIVAQDIQPTEKALAAATTMIDFGTVSESVAAIPGKDNPNRSITPHYVRSIATQTDPMVLIFDGLDKNVRIHPLSDLNAIKLQGGSYHNKNQEITPLASRSLQRPDNDYELKSFCHPSTTRGVANLSENDTTTEPGKDVISGSTHSFRKDDIPSGAKPIIATMLSERSFVEKQIEEEDYIPVEAMKEEIVEENKVDSSVQDIPISAVEDENTRTRHSFGKDDSPSGSKPVIATILSERSFVDIQKAEEDSILVEAMNGDIFQEIKLDNIIQNTPVLVVEDPLNEGCKADDAPTYLESFTTEKENEESNEPLLVVSDGLFMTDESKRDESVMEQQKENEKHDTNQPLTKSVVGTAHFDVTESGEERTAEHITESEKSKNAPATSVERVVEMQPQELQKLMQQPEPEPEPELVLQQLQLEQPLQQPQLQQPSQQTTTELALQQVEQQQMQPQATEKELVQKEEEVNDAEKEKEEEEIGNEQHHQQDTELVQEEQRPMLQHPQIDQPVVPELLQKPLPQHPIEPPILQPLLTIQQLQPLQQFQQQPQTAQLSQQQQQPLQLQTQNEQLVHSQFQQQQQMQQLQFQQQQLLQQLMETQTLQQQQPQNTHLMQLQFQQQQQLQHLQSQQQQLLRQQIETQTLLQQQHVPQFQQQPMQMFQQLQQPFQPQLQNGHVPVFQLQLQSQQQAQQPQQELQQQPQLPLQQQQQQAMQQQSSHSATQAEKLQNDHLPGVQLQLQPQQQAQQPQQQLLQQPQPHVQPQLLSEQQQQSSNLSTHAEKPKPYNRIVDKLQKQAQRKLQQEKGANSSGKPEFMALFNRIGGKNANFEVIETSGAKPAADAVRGAFGENTMKGKNGGVAFNSMKYETTKGWKPRKRQGSDSDSSSDSIGNGKSKSSETDKSDSCSVSTHRYIKDSDSEEDDPPLNSTPKTTSTPPKPPTPPPKAPSPPPTPPEPPKPAGSDSDTDSDSSSDKRKKAPAPASNPARPPPKQAAQPTKQKSSLGDSDSDSDSSSDKRKKAPVVVSKPAPPPHKKAAPAATKKSFLDDSDSDSDSS